MKIIHYLTFLILFSTAHFLLSSTPSLAISPNALHDHREGPEYIENWEYHEGDFNIENDLASQFAAAKWEKITGVLKPAIQGERKNAWMRVKLGKVFDQDVMYIKAIDQDFEVYFDGKIYLKHGVLSKEGIGTFIDWRPHFINLGSGYSGKYMYFRIYSDHSSIGFTGVPIITSKVKLIKQIFSNEISTYFVAMCLLVMGVLALLIISGGGEKGLFLSASLVSISGSIYLFTKTTFPFIVSDSMSWIHVEVGSLGFIPVGYAFYLSKISDGKARTIFTYLGSLCLAIVSTLLLLSAANLLPIYKGLIYIQLGALLTLGYSLYIVTKGAWQGDKVFKILFSGVVFAGACIFHDILASIGVLNSNLRLGTFAGLSLFSSMSFAAGYEFRQSNARMRTLRIEKEQEIAASLRDRMDALSTLAAGVAHEINNPLAIIQASLFNIQRTLSRANDESISKSGDQYMKKITTSINRIHNITQSLVLASKESTDDQVVVPLTVVMLRPIEKLMESAQEMEISVEVESAPSDLYISCLIKYLEEALIGILSNALEAASQQSNKWVKVCFENDEQNVKILIVDSGHGINESQIQKIFEPFYTTKDIGDGAGLGLSVARKIIKNMKGKLDVDFTQNNTTFVITLPLAGNSSEENNNKHFSHSA